MSTGATTVAAGAALAACLASAPEIEQPQPVALRAVESAVVTPPEQRHVRARPTPTPPAVDAVGDEVDGIVIVEEPTVEPAPQRNVEPAALPSTDKPPAVARRSTADASELPSPAGTSSCSIRSSLPAELYISTA